jgi:hypothetical protein
VVIGSRHRLASGDWAAYEAQTEFDYVFDEELGRLVLPQEIEPAVLMFWRKKGTIDGKAQRA